MKESRVPHSFDSKLVSWPKGSIAGSVSVFELLSVKLRKYLFSGNVMNELDFESLKATKNLLMVEVNKYAQLSNILLESKVIELVDKRTIKIDGLFAVEKDKT